MRTGKLVFDDLFDARGDLRPEGGSWAKWFDRIERPPIYACVWSGPPVNGHPGAPLRIGGYFREPLESVVGLRAFDDALEGTIQIEGYDRPVPYVFFEIEKIARMMLHRSDLAFEILASPGRLSPMVEGEEQCQAREIAGWTIADGLLDAYRESTEGGVDDLREGREVSVGEILRLLGRLTTGAGLAKGRASFDIAELTEREDGEVVAELLDREPSETVESPPGELVELVGELDRTLRDDSPDLPEDPEEYESLNQWLVDQRLSET